MILNITNQFLFAGEGPRESRRHRTAGRRDPSSEHLARAREDLLLPGSVHPDQDREGNHRNFGESFIIAL